MKEFKVTNEMYKNGNVVDASRDNYAGDYVTAESEAEAIELYKDFLIEQIRNNNLNAEIIDDEIVVTDDEENEGEVVKTKRFAVKPMNVDEAILQMELIGHNFFVYKDSDTNDINVLYKRKDGNYGLLEPEYQ